MPIVTSETLDTVFTYHRPTKEQAERYELLRNRAKQVAYYLLSPPDDSRLASAWVDFTQAITDECHAGVVHERAIAMDSLSEGMATPNRQKKMICLRQALMWANAAIACNEPDADAQEADLGPGAPDETISRSKRFHRKRLEHQSGPPGPERDEYVYVTSDGVQTQNELLCARASHDWQQRERDRFDFLAETASLLRSDVAPRPPDRCSYCRAERWLMLPVPGSAR